MRKVKRFKRKSGFGYLLFLITWCAIWAAMAFGWVLNVIKLVGHARIDDFSAMFILRCIGVPAAPLGAILGWL